MCLVLISNPCVCLLVTSPAVNTWTCWHFPNTLTTCLLNVLCRERVMSAIKDDAPAPFWASYYVFCGVTHVCIVLLDIYDCYCSCCLNLVPLLCLAFSWFNTMSSRVDWNRNTWILDRMLLSLCPRILSHLASYNELYQVKPIGIMWPGLQESTMWVQITLSYIFISIFTS